MTSDKPIKSKPAQVLRPAEIALTPRGKQPEWSNGLRQLYDSVLEEPLPDMFKDLLSRLDSKD